MATDSYDDDRVAGDDPIPGTLLLETYRAMHFLGGGALGRVYAARHVRVPRMYAVKFPRACRFS